MTIMQRSPREQDRIARQSLKEFLESMIVALPRMYDIKLEVSARRDIREAPYLLGDPVWMSEPTGRVTYSIEVECELVASAKPRRKRKGSHP